MGTRSNENGIRPNSSGEERQVVPWELSGVFTDSAVIKNQPGVFGGIVITFTWGIEELSVSGDAPVAAAASDWPGNPPDPKWWPPPWWLIVWDSPDADTAGDVVLAYYPFPSGAVLGQVFTTVFPMVGVYAHLGVYVEVSAPGDFEYSVCYR